MHIRTILSLGGAVFLAPLSGPGVRADDVPTIVISGSRFEQPTTEVPASLTVINSDAISQSGSRSLPELLQGRAGVQVDDPFGSGANAVIDIRGFGPTAGSNSLVLLDGRRLNNSGDLAAPDLNSLDVDTIERIEIVQGSAGIIYGNQAVGGLVNIISRDPDVAETRIGASVGSYGRQRLAGHTNQPLQNGLSLALAASADRADNYRDHNRSETEKLRLRLGGKGEDFLWFAEHQYIADDLETPGALFADEMAADRRQAAAAYANDYTDTRTHASRIGGTLDLNDRWELAGDFTYRSSDRDFVTSFRTFPGSPSTQDRIVRSLSPRLRGYIPIQTGDMQVTLGADLERTDYALHTAFGPQLLDQSIDALYAQAMIPLSPEWSTTAGIRHARVNNRIDTDTSSEDLDDSKTIGSLGLTYRPAPGWRLFARAEGNYRFATVDEHTNVVSGQPVGIRNQSGMSYESGIQWDGARGEVKLIAYQLDLDDEINFDASGFVNTNLDKTRRRGLLLEGQWQARPDLSVGASLSYTDAEISTGPFKDKRIPLVAEESARLFAQWNPNPAWSFMGEAVFMGKRVLGGDFNNSFPRLASYGVVNAAVRYQRDAWDWQLRINNLLDKDYIASGSVGFDASFTPRDAYFPAPERNLWLTVGYRFD